MSKKSTKVTVTFDGFSGYYGYMSNYNGTKSGGGFDWSEIYYFTSKGINTYYPDEHTGYNNDLALGKTTGVGFSLAEDNTSTGYGWGAFYSPSKETFTLKSADVASAWDTEQTVAFTTYKGTKKVATVDMTISQKGQLVDFAKGKDKKDFTDITKVKFETNNKYATNESSSYGKGWQVVVTNIKAVWAGKLPGAHNNAHHVAHGVLAALAGESHGANADLGSNGGSSSSHGVHTDGSFHSAITADSLHHDAGSLTSEFSLGGHF